MKEVLMICFNVTHEQAGHIFHEADEYQLRGAAGLRWDGNTMIVVPNGHAVPEIHLERCTEISVNSTASPQWVRAVRIYRALYPNIQLMQARKEMLKLLEECGCIKFKLSLK